MTKKTKELGSQLAKTTAASSPARGNPRRLTVDDLPRTESSNLTKAVQLQERGLQLVYAADYLEATLLEIGVIDVGPKNGQEGTRDEGTRYTTMEGLCDLLASARRVDDSVYVFVNGPDMGEDGDGCAADSDKSEPKHKVVEKTDFGRRVLAKSNSIHQLFRNVHDNLNRIEISLMPQEPISGAIGPKGEKGPSGPTGEPDYSAIELIINLEEAAHSLEMRILQVNQRLRDNY